MQQINSSEIQTSTARATFTVRSTSGNRKFSRMNLAVFLCTMVLFASNYECKSLLETSKKY